MKRAKSLRHQFTAIFMLPGLALLSACEKEEGNLPTTRPPAAQEETAAEPPANQPPMVYAFSMLAPGADGKPVIFARMVYDALNQPCPVLTGSDQSTLKTTERPKNPLSNGAQLSDTDFPVTVCEAVMSPNTAYSHQQDGISLAAVKPDPHNVQVYGDSGCKVSDCGVAGVSSDFEALANLGATQPRDLILHMGDYNYRGTSGHFAKSPSGSDIYAYDAGDIPHPVPSCTYNDTYYSQNSSNSPKPDSWQYWKADFFAAAKTLLPTAPWVFARGNHELCSRAGTGWFYFLGPGSSLANSGVSQMQCPDQGDFNNPPPNVAQQIEMIPPYMLEMDNLQLWVMDSANACDTYHSNPLTAEYLQQYEQLAAQTVNNKPTWLVSHRPIWGYQDGGSINNMLQTALADSAAAKLPAAVKLSLAGHMHIYESLTFFDHAGETTARPPQIIIGNSGVALGGAPGPGTAPTIDGQTTKYSAAQDFGYLQMQLQSNGDWRGQVSDQAGAAIVHCDSRNPVAGNAICGCDPSNAFCNSSSPAAN